MKSPAPCGLRRAILWWMPARESKRKRWPMYLALDNNLEILPVINKVDLPSARPDEVAQEIEEVIGRTAAMHCASARKPAFI